ncbi:MAG: PepSY domain-containing protein [Rhodospirillales bacterium]|nr:PepSY domain-containing protein [Rhodospirillales bacterium]MDH3917415.1 PepSY domain-containing protein [Rhodospirillales bacterium]MDH3967404.1 PepSY domain-containing protein [Rhodospirillales bacterium]
MRHVLTAAAALVFAVCLSLGALASEDEKGKKALKMEGTMPLSVIVKQLEESGYKKIAEIEFERGLYEIKGRKADDSWFEIYVDAHTGEVVK